MIGLMIDVLGFSVGGKKVVFFDEIGVLRLMGYYFSGVDKLNLFFGFGSWCFNYVLIRVFVMDRVGGNWRCLVLIWLDIF